MPKGINKKVEQLGSIPLILLSGCLKKMARGKLCPRGKTIPLSMYPGMAQRRTVHGRAEICQPKRNGSMPPKAWIVTASHGEMMLRIVIKRVFQAVETHLSKQEACCKVQISGAYSIWPAMSRNG